MPIAPASVSAPSTLRMRKSPVPKVAGRSSMTRPICRPRAALARSSGSSDSTTSRSRSSAGWPPSSRMTLRSALGDHERRADRPAPLGHDRLDVGTAGEQEPDRAVGLHLVVEDEAGAPRALGPGHQATGDGEGGAGLGELGEEPLRRERERIGEQNEGAVAVGDPAGKALQGPAAGGARGLDAHWLDGAGAGGPHRHARLVLDLAVATDDRAGRCADQHRGRRIARTAPAMSSSAPAWPRSRAPRPRRASSRSARGPRRRPLPPRGWAAGARTGRRRPARQPAGGSSV
jgi:hypothetical protein